MESLALVGEASRSETIADRPSTLAYFCADFNASSNVYFQPTILRQLGYTASQAQIHAIPIYMTAFAISIFSAYASDRLRIRSVFALSGAILCTVGWAIELAQAGPPGARYAALFLIVSGAFIQMPNLVVWAANNMQDDGVKRAIATAVMIGGGNCAAFLSGNVFLGSQAPKYPAGYGTGLGVTLGGAVCILVLVRRLMVLNEHLEHNIAKEDAQGTSVRGNEPSVSSFRYVL